MDLLLEIGKNHTSNMPWLSEKTIFLVKHGSHAYGLNTPTSDLDVKGVAKAPKDYVLGFTKVFEQATGKLPHLDAEYTVYELRKFFRLAADCNPSIIEVLWVQDSDILHMTRLGDRLRMARSLFLSKKAKHTFSGYAMSQLKRINTHHRWLLDPPKAPPTRGEYGLPERTVIPANQLKAAQAAISKQLDRWCFREGEDMDPATRLAAMEAMSTALAEMAIGAEEQFWAAGRMLSYTDNFLELLDRERRYEAAQHEWKSYLNWKQTRNPARAELEAKHGYDTKHAMHLVRLMRMCEEILTMRMVWVKRQDREELLAIRNGAWKYDDLLQWAKNTDIKLADLYATSTLPHSPDKKVLDDICVQIMEDIRE